MISYPFLLVDKILECVPGEYAVVSLHTNQIHIRAPYIISPQMREAMQIRCP